LAFFLRVLSENSNASLLQYKILHRARSELVEE